LETHPHLRRSHRGPWIAEAIKLLAFAALYGVVALGARVYAQPHGYASLFWPPSGLALAALVIGGRRYAWGIVLGILISYIGTPQLSSPAIAGLALGPALEALLGHWLLTSAAGFDPHFKDLRDFGQLMTRGALAGGVVGAAVGTTSLVLTGDVSLGAWLQMAVSWWMGDALGVLLVTPFVLIWWTTIRSRLRLHRLLEGLLLVAVAVLIGQIVFLDWLHGALAPFALGYLVFPMLIFAGLRLGTHGTVTILLVTAIQALSGAHRGSGFFRDDISASGLQSYWLYMTTLATVGLALTTYFAQRKRVATDLRIAAIAFECQEGILIADRDRKILRVNRAFTQMTGYALEDVKGKVTGFARSNRHPNDDYEAAWDQVRRLGHWQGDRWLQRKNGEHYFSRIGITAVRDDNDEITHFVGYSTDISHVHQIEQKRLRDEAALRVALVREVNHRIKNSLQGVVGLLRRYPQKNPELTDLINQAVSQVHGIAAVHGLQGSSSSLSVGLCDLTRMIARQVQALWQTQIAVDISPRAEPFIVAEKEAVPIALILNELIVNACKHGAADGAVTIHIDGPADVSSARISIGNDLKSTLGPVEPGDHSLGLDLVSVLMPRRGAELSDAHEDARFVTRLTLQPPVVFHQQEESK